MLIVKREAGRIKQDTIAKVSNKGLLGDKMIELAGGSPSAAVVPAEGTLQSEDPTDFTNLFSEVGNMTQRADKILGNLEVTTKALADAQLHEDIQRSVHSVSVILKEVAEGKGYVRRVLSDPDEAARLSHLVTMLDRVAVEAEGTVGEARKTMARVNSGPGFVHEVLYGEKGADAMANFGGAAAEVIAALRGIREGNGLAHTVIYGGDETSAQVSANLGAMTYDLRQIIADLRAGKGTLGALLVDPSLYEDVKGVLGNVQRNDALRALVRYSIKQDEKRPAVRVSDQPAPTSKPAR
jgi:phospholipid/cholesterol/gamma-HCH transport system substrate-binding protein